MPVVGRIKEIWRYPVKSMQGERLQSCEFDQLGLLGDRGWALRDNEVGEIRGAKKLPKLMRCRALYVNETFDDDVPHVDVHLPDGSVINSGSATASAALSDFLGTDVCFAVRGPSRGREHHKRLEELDEQELRRLLGQRPDEPLADLSVFPASLLAQITELSTPLGAYYDVYPVHLITTSSMQTLTNLRPASRFEVPRFRPNLVIDAANEGLPEFDWCGSRLKIGGVELNCEIPTIRCVMSSHGTGDLPTDIDVLSTIARKTDRKLGAYATVNSPGTIHVGDEVALG